MIFIMKMSSVMIMLIHDTSNYYNPQFLLLLWVTKNIDGDILKIIKAFGKPLVAK